MREPLFTQVTQIGMVVPDLEAAIRHYEEDYGIGPWQRWELDPERASDVQVNGQPAELWRVKVASAMVGSMHWELTEPLDDQSIFGKFLVATGGGVHHLAVAAPGYDAALAVPAGQGRELVMSGTFYGVRVSYLPTDRDLGVLLEVFDRMPGDVGAPDAT